MSGQTKSLERITGWNALKCFQAIFLSEDRMILHVKFYFCRLDEKLNKVKKPLVGFEIGLLAYRWQSLTSLQGSDTCFTAELLLKFLTLWVHKIANRQHLI